MVLSVQCEPLSTGWGSIFEAGCLAGQRTPLGKCGRAAFPERLAIDEMALLAARGAGSPISFTAWLMPSGDHSPSTRRVAGGEAAHWKAYDALIALPERTPDALFADKGLRC